MIVKSTTVQRNKEATLRKAQELRKHETNVAHAINHLVMAITFCSDSDGLLRDYYAPERVEIRKSRLEDALALLVEEEALYMKVREAKIQAQCTRKIEML